MTAKISLDEWFGRDKKFWYEDYKDTCLCMFWYKGKKLKAKLDYTNREILDLDNNVLRRF